MRQISENKRLENKILKMKCAKRKQRLYAAKGPNYLWHTDGYDKLKPFGFCIHDAIDGYSRSVLWLEIVGKYYADYVDAIAGTAGIIRADRGTENVNVEAMKRFFTEHQRTMNLIMYEL